VTRINQGRDVWASDRIGNLGRWYSGGTPSLSMKQYWNGDVPWVSPKDMKRARLRDAIDHITQDAVADGARVVGPGAVFIVVRGMILAHSLPVALTEQPASFNQDIKALVTRSDIHAGFVLYWLLANKQKLHRLVTESTHGTKRLPTEVLFSQEVRLPSFSEQCAISEAMTDVDMLLEQVHALIAKKRSLKEAAMQQLLTGRQRLPGFRQQWSTRMVAQIAEVKTGPFGSTLHERDYVENGTPIITVEHLGEFGVTRQNLPMVSASDLLRLRAYSLRAGDIVFSRVGSVDRNALIREAEDGWLFSGRLLRVRPNRRLVDPAYLSYQFHGHKFKCAVATVAVGQTMASLNTAILNNLPVEVPPLAEQSAIATILGQIDSEICALEARLHKAVALKQAMMQQLLTGRIRLA